MSQEGWVPVTVKLSPGTFCLNRNSEFLHLGSTTLKFANIGSSVLLHLFLRRVVGCLDGVS